ncbi:MAG: alpha/beta hydrolase [Deltaproteobacteria bacterium]|nr:MAG: alpha/beta hydrolase [Deltaproteobacteria bacterium]TMQ17676.1 MAG: alpha/beta hydrolase [Deltaproteobacteria bacterium]
MQTRRIPLATGLTYHVYEWGQDTPGELTFVLIHGFSDLGYTWSEVAERLAPHGHVVAPDMRGHGDTDWIGPGGYYHYMDYLADLDDVIRQLARPRVVLAGHSMGCGIASYYAGTRPQRIAALALFEGIGPPDMTGRDGPDRTAAWIDTWRTARSQQRVMPSVEDAARRMRKHDDRLDAAQALRLAERGTRPVDGGVTWKHDPLHRTMGPYPFRVELAIKYWQRITCPVIIADGADSRLTLPADERARRRACFANHRHVVVPDAGHMITRHQPARVAELILGLAA